MGLLTEPRKQETKRHLDECLACNGIYALIQDKVEANSEKVNAFVQDLRKECAMVEPMLLRYRDRKLSPEMDKMVYEHLNKKICDQCNQKYHEVIEEKETEQIRKEETKSNVGFIFINEINDYIKKGSAGLSAGGKTPAKSSAKGYSFEVAKKNIQVGIKQSGYGAYAIQLKSDKYDVAGVTISLGKKTTTGFTPLLTAVTTNKGTAKLGNAEYLQDAEEKSKYSLHVSGLKKKIK